MRWFATLLTVVAVSALARSAEPPAHLPRYDLTLDLNTNRHLVTLRERITWTNPADRPTNQLVLNFYPRFAVNPKEELLLAKTLEVLRLNPSDGYDPAGRHGEIEAVSLVGADPTAALRTLQFRYREDSPTVVEIDLPQAVQPGERVTVELDARIRLPNKQGRWGYWNGVHFLAYSIPIVAFYDSAGWHAMPFVPWHQPYWHEAGVYTATITVPNKQKVG